jgi:hypothetical protein
MADRMFIRVHQGMPESPLIEGLSDRAFRDLFAAMYRSRNGYVDVDTIPAKSLAELWEAGVVNAAGLLLIHGDLFEGPYRVRDVRPTIPLALRQAVYERDGYTCVTCGADRPLSLDHIYPWSLGGPDTLENLQTMCVPCNCRKGDRV